jgi:hypothetical protein
MADIEFLGVIDHSQTDRWAHPGPVADNRSSSSNSTATFEAGSVATVSYRFALQ